MSSLEIERLPPQAGKDCDLGIYVPVSFAFGRPLSAVRFNSEGQVLPHSVSKNVPLCSCGSSVLCLKFKEQTLKRRCGKLVLRSVFWEKANNLLVAREGVNREKLTVKKIINNEMFFSPFMSLTNREKSAQTVKKSAPNREKIGAKNPPFFHR